MQPAPIPNEPCRRAHLAETAASHASAPSPVLSTDLFKGQKSVVIEHNGASYRLQTTKLGKLILTK
jgi:hemin uptake protein HemP